MPARAALVAVLLLVPLCAWAADASSVRLLGQQPPNLLDVSTSPWGTRLVLEARVALDREGALYVKLVPAPEDRNHAYRNGTVGRDGAADAGWVHRVRLLDDAGAPVTRDAAGKAVASDLGATTGEAPLGPVRLAAGTYRVRSTLAVPPEAAPEGPLPVQVRYHIALSAAEHVGAGGGGVQDPAVAAEWNLVVRRGTGAPAEDAPSEDPTSAAGRRPLQGDDAENLSTLLGEEAREAPAPAALAAALALVLGGALRRRRA